MENALRLQIEALREQLLIERAERAAERERAALLEDFIENASISLHWVGPDGSILWANQDELDFLGYAREEYVGRNITEFHTDQRVISDILCRLGRNETLRNYEARLRCKNGDEKTVLINSNVLWRDGTFVHTRCFTRDISDIKRQVLATRESEERYRALIEQANDAIFVADAESGIILDANRRAEHLLGRPIAEIKGMHQTHLHPPEMLDAYGRIFREHAAAGGGMLVKDIFVQDASGRHVPVEISANVIPLNGKPALQGIFRDVTERKRAEAELAEKTAELTRSNAELELFAATASHDLQEPLRMISSYLNLLERRCGAAFDERGHGYMKQVCDAALRMQNLVRALLSYAKVGQGELAFEPVTMLTALSEAVEHLEDKVAATRAHIAFDDLPIVRGDRTLLVQLFQNLIGNALKFCDGRDPKIRIDARDSGKEWTFTVADNGIGIDQADQQRIFKAFERLHGPSRYAGTGLGLATCRKIVDVHRGRIWVESTPGVGSTFCFTIGKE